MHTWLNCDFCRRGLQHVDTNHQAAHIPTWPHHVIDLLTACAVFDTEMPVDGVSFDMHPQLQGVALFSGTQERERRQEAIKGELQSQGLELVRRRQVKQYMA